MQPTLCQVGRMLRCSSCLRSALLRAHAVCTGEVEEEGYGDEYQLEDLEVSAADYMVPVMVPNFRKAWCV